MSTKVCIHFNSAVCKDIKEREVFESILEKLHPETYICPYAVYEVTNNVGDKIYLPTLKSIPKGRLGYYIKDTFSFKIIYLKQNNFKVLCAKESGICNCNPYVAEFKYPATTKDS